MNLIVDSSVWIDGFNPKMKTAEKEVLRQLILNDYPIYLCPVIYQEVLQGIRENKTFEEVKHILQQYQMVDIDVMDATNYAINLYRHLRKKGITIRKSIDCLIASYTILGDMHILHSDSDFTKIAQESKLKIYKI
ncbi:MAG: PIN domain-containing protein [Spirochaetaceae bacterium]|jgi:predicted nucleic acid-binding protein|nr:PIN domain-containing protein [Spirochaetaceae bacterium]